MTAPLPAVNEPGMAGHSNESPRLTTRKAVIAVVTLIVLAALLILNFAFSTSNTPQSINGRTATSSQYLDRQ